MIKKWFLLGAVILGISFSAFISGAQTSGETPKGSKVLLDLQLGQAVFLCFHSATEPELDRIKGEIGAVVANFKSTVDAVYVAGNDKKEDSFRAKFEVSADETAVFVIAPSGQATAKLKGVEVTKANLMRALSSSSGGCGSGCGSGCS